MTDVVRDTLCGMIRYHGREIIDEPDRCVGMLNDLCPKEKRAVHLLVCALRERVPTELSSQGGLPLSANVERLARRLEQSLGLSMEAARWGVETWALALGVASLDALKAAEAERNTAARTSSSPSPDAQRKAAPPQQAKPQPAQASFPPKLPTYPTAKKPYAPPPPVFSSPPAAAPLPVTPLVEVESSEANGGSWLSALGGFVVLAVLIGGGIFLYQKANTKPSAANHRIHGPSVASPPANDYPVGFPSSTPPTWNDSAASTAKDAPSDGQSFQLGDPQGQKDFTDFLVGELQRQAAAAKDELPQDSKALPK